MGLLKRLWRDDRAQEMAEYGIALAVIAVGAGIAAVAMASGVNVVWSVAASLTASAFPH
jgi:Flp pilus assembly pilin Flp